MEMQKAFSDENGTTSGEEGSLTKSIERVTTQIPSGVFLSAGIASIAASALLHFGGRKQDSRFVGQWVPTFLILGLYNKMVKLHGSERH